MSDTVAVFVGCLQEDITIALAPHVHHDQVLPALGEVRKRRLRGPFPFARCAMDHVQHAVLRQEQHVGFGIAINVRGLHAGCAVARQPFTLGRAPNADVNVLDP